MSINQQVPRFTNYFYITWDIWFINTFFFFRNTRHIFLFTRRSEPAGEFVYGIFAYLLIPLHSILANNKILRHISPVFLFILTQWLIYILKASFLLKLSVGTGEFFLYFWVAFSLQADKWQMQWNWKKRQWLWFVLQFLHPQKRFWSFCSNNRVQCLSVNTLVPYEKA